MAREKDSIASSDEHNSRGIELADRGWLDEALKEFKKAIELDPNSSHAHDNLATVFAEKKQFREQGPLSWRLESLLNSVLGAALGAGLLYLLGEAYFRWRGREGLGFGDVKMMAMVGAFLGAPLALLTIMLGSLLGSIIGLVFMQLSGAAWSRPRRPQRRGDSPRFTRAGKRVC